jgi:hypothetical protein
MIERGNKSQVVAGGSHIDVTARLIRLGFPGEAVFISLSDVVFAKIVDGLAQAFDGLIGAAAGIGSTPSRPPHKTNIFAPSSAPRSMARKVFCKA